jgi:Tol biopolymer transport system component
MVAGISSDGRYEVRDAVLSADGRWAAFSSAATDLVAGQLERVIQNTQAAPDIFLWDRDSGLTRLVSHQVGLATSTAGNCWPLQGLGISADGNQVVFGSLAPDLVAGQSGASSASDVFLYDRATDTQPRHGAGDPGRERLFRVKTDNPSLASGLFDGGRLQSSH